VLVGWLRGPSREIGQRDGGPATDRECVAPVRALFFAPKALWSALPVIAQLAFAVVFVIIQFVAIFWFLSRGGIDTYFPDISKLDFLMFGVKITCSRASKRTLSS